jgi:AraC-like DNA-binding protein
MLTQAIRIQLVENDAAEPSQTRALRDPHIATAIHLIHARPGERWTVERLAKEVGYSRSAFAARFRQLVGESPMAYVTRTRLADASRQLQHSNMSISEIARRAGYASDASFARAFKRAFEVAPGAYRT